MRPPSAGSAVYLLCTQEENTGFVFCQFKRHSCFQMCDTYIKLFVMKIMRLLFILLTSKTKLGCNKNKVNKPTFNMQEARIFSY